MSLQRPPGFIASQSQRRSETVDIQRYGDGSKQTVTDFVTVEEPLEIRLAGDAMEERALAVTMRTPGQDDELALGFLLGEGVIGSIEDVAGIEHCRPPDSDKGYHNVICVTLSPGVAIEAERFTRHFYASSSCGVCGKASIDSVMSLPRGGRTQWFTMTSEALLGLPEKLRTQQDDFARTGGIHAAGLIDANGELVATREDVGRHNAVDKLIGACLIRGEVPLAGHGLMLSGRAGFELVQKAAVAGVEFVAAIGPPSSLAVELADSAGLTLAGFVNPTGFNLYTHSERVL